MICGERARPDRRQDTDTQCNWIGPLLRSSARSSIPKGSARSPALCTSRLAEDVSRSHTTHKCKRRAHLSAAPLGQGGAN